MIVVSFGVGPGAYDSRRVRMSKKRFALLVEGRQVTPARARRSSRAVRASSASPASTSTSISWWIRPPGKLGAVQLEEDLELASRDGEGDRAEPPPVVAESPDLEQDAILDRGEHRREQGGRGLADSLDQQKQRRALTREDRPRFLRLDEDLLLGPHGEGTGILAYALPLRGQQEASRLLAQPKRAPRVPQPPVPRVVEVIRLSRRRGDRRRRVRHLRDEGVEVRLGVDPELELVLFLVHEVTPGRILGDEIRGPG